MLSHVTKCETHGCSRQGRSIAGKRHEYAAQLFTRRRGVLPIRVVTLYCKECHTTYRPNYIVRNASSPDATRVYYQGIPDALEVSEHTYIERDLVVLFRAQMAFAHASGDTVARVYNLGLSSQVSSPPLTGAMVWSAFYLHALLSDQQELSSQLELPHHGRQNARFEAALRERNQRMRGIGQRLWAHACDDCERVSLAPDGCDGSYTRLSACVMDGVTIGHPRCNERHCRNTLRSPQDRFCQEHTSLHDQCAIEGCTEVSATGFRTCNSEVHRAYEIEKRERGTAIYRLRLRAEKASDRRAQGSRRPKVRSALTRRWTHNEQLMVRPCRIIISRATFFESEGPAETLRFVLDTFPSHLPRSRPSFLIYDNNCNLLKHIRASGLQDLYHTALTVDVFHANTKHSDRDEFCQENCNPALFPELYDDAKGEWVFNSSVCEQVNAWFGKFLAVVREMSEVHYNFFLDEMIAVYNEYREKILHKRGKRPRLIPLDELKLCL
ncbi:hypothetical protein L226DRAFT_468036 [Lentinus tigrinus ALCF2SS1-7]|uniref:CxC6 like cysteine cluster associated with KDZ domain-containing protein n=1 Tax=Lentinus tigrinus ALCF2SS1-6 TaxID=1328759 RepID=A0A5C2RL90_9APHY|nr:hypothetical protein L227DRAFT_514842 [Lentinus tigrinus ALCF2SS1-6]RPD67917.1 hypothetical protein L226DRAFT_474222 [Lentinus tigrinus ALCF2SS1-7]RPD71823.1 hypothetical protein L226DRAFT_468036 [Lentinus tigrinus ALCF2SS1-7]